MKLRYDVGLITTHVSPAKGYGGVAVSAARLMAAWSKVPSRHIGICSSNASGNGSIRADDAKLSKNTDVHLYHAYWFKRWGLGLGAIHRLISLCLRSRVIYLNGISTWPTTLGAIICCLCRRPFVVAPRGGLMPEHIEHIQQKYPAKWVFYKLFTLPWIKKARAFHCTGNIEADAVMTHLGENLPLILAPNGISLPPAHAGAPSLVKDNLILSYVGRISHEKGINTFLRAWLKAKRPGDRILVAGASSGNSEADYFKEFQHLVGQSGGAIEYRGYLSAPMVNDLIANSHFLVMPSGLDGDIRENFGTAVAESLALSRPAIVSKGLVWDDLEAKHAGFLFDRSFQAAFDVIHLAASIQTETWIDMTKKARHYAEQHLDIRVTAEKVWDAVISCDRPYRHNEYASGRRVWE